MSHYERFDFGIHGIWMNNKLIGQFGLQVLDEEKDEIEIVVFLGKKYRNKGIGQKLFKYLLDNCKASKMKVVYGVVRSDNPAAINLVSKFNTRRIRTIKHYNHPGILFKFELK